jgi:hypothetical protein
MVGVDVDPVIPQAGASAWVDALAAIAGAWNATVSRWGPGSSVAGVGVVTVWRSVCAATSGALLSPSWPVSPSGW